ncbi:hypothetical protein K469DRAFT_626053 [Zopfia rhizophila CBS 207.26]|uniref:RING-type domain-containing protein n=1 Tax=Zopfia rhizophila CBS 207.26 TaxID=1314779 RepID=A0A6A6EB15_9PEZI|nr:hypothetical protein K469DRAFT_626053 [Zopfia rhizophila CBS 207.26]
MSANSIGIFTIEFPDPYMLSYYNDRFETLAANISFQYPITSNIQTLSSKSVEKGNDPYGILFVPDLQSDGCKNSEKDHVPENATRLSNLPRDADYSLVAFAPWFAPLCMQEYLDAARRSPVKAFLVYQPGQSATMPPPMNDPSWGLEDGGSWKAANRFPVYALASISGGIIMDQLSKYSGNITDAPHGHDLASIYDLTSYVRLWATINTGSGNQLPSLWVFLVIVLGLLVLIIVSTSTCMHLIQRRRRNDLRQRVINGEVNLEAFGVKRLTVPQQYLDKLPLYTYTNGPRDADPEKSVLHEPPPAKTPPSTALDVETGMKSTAAIRHSSALSATATDPPAWSQPTCPICLDDFEPNETQVRELLCRHIFHPDCVDTFLLSNSSLCPMCKHSVLPSGYCPAKITNVMVRRERMIRRMRARSGANARPITEQTEASSSPRTPYSRGVGSLGSRIGGVITGRRVFSAPERSQTRPPDIEMAGANASPPESNSSPPPINANSDPNAVPEITPAPAQSTAPAQTNCSQPTSPTQNRREWARQRALALLAHHAPADGSEEENPGSRWRRGLRKVFPGFM